MNWWSGAGSSGQLMYWPPLIICIMIVVFILVIVCVAFFAVVEFLDRRAKGRG